MNVRQRRKNHEEGEPLLSDREEDVYRDVPSQPLAKPSYSYISLFLSSCWDYVSFFWIEFRKMVLSGSNNTLPDIDPIVKQQMSDFQKYITIPFNIEDPTHNEELLRLWNIFFPEEPFSLQSPLWKKLGFQSDNPLTDFRASGFFGLKNILYFAEKYPSKFHLLVDVHEKRPGSYYPFAIASFNITMLICELLGWGWKRPGVSTAKDPKVKHKLISMLFPANYSIELCENVFAELYCLALVETDQEWNDSKASYMDFPVVISNSQERLEKLIRKFNGIEDLYTHNQLNLV